MGLSYEHGALRAEQVIALLGLKPHPEESWYRRDLS